MMIRTIRRATVTAAALIALGAVSVVAQTQDNDPTIVDKIVAVVGDSVILRSQLDEARQQIQLQGGTVPLGGPALDQFNKNLLNQLVDNLLVLQAAEKDTLVKVDEAQVDQTVNDEIQRRSQAFAGGGPAFQQALLKQGFTLAEYRDYLKSQVHQQQIYRAYMQLRLQDAPPVEVSEDELHAAFDSAKSTLQQRPRTVSFSQVIITPTPSDSAWAAAKAKAQAILDSIHAGADFATLAERYSQDPGTASKGGELGWFRRGAVIKPLEDAAWSLYVGGVSGLVKSDIGYHIVKLERARLGERDARHILIRPELTAADVALAQLRADSVANMARAGTSMEKLYDTYSDSTAPDTIADIAFNQMSQVLPPAYGQALQTASVGQVLGPLEYTTAQGEKRFAVLRVNQIRQAGAYTFDDVKAELAQKVKQDKQVEKIVEDLKRHTYIDIRM
ncbi:MAG: peptidylprolyl isomerase [Gemmatimonadetes bacterium]|nr:peptidylprolyl isomerase [Gemmatimonadota bacterium]